MSIKRVLAASATLILGSGTFAAPPANVAGIWTLVVDQTVFAPHGDYPFSGSK